MKRVGLLLVLRLVIVGIILSIPVSLFARDVIRNVVRQSDESASIAVASTGTVYTKYFTLGDAEYFGIGYWVYSASGSADVTIQLEQSHVVPTTEGSSDGNYTIPVNMADIVTDLTTESTWYYKSLSPIPMQYGRFKIKGIGSNNADTIVKIYLFKQVD